MTTKTVAVRFRLTAENVACLLALSCYERNARVPTNVKVADALIRERLQRHGDSYEGIARCTAVDLAEARTCVAFLYPELAKPAPPSPSTLHPSPSTLSRLR